MGGKKEGGAGEMRSTCEVHRRPVLILLRLDLAASGFFNPVKETTHCTKSLFFEKAFSEVPEAYFVGYILGHLLKRKSQDYGSNIKKRAKR